MVVQADDLNTGIEQLIVAMITSNLSREGHPSRIWINKDSEDGKTACILTDSIIMTDNPATVRFIEIEKAIGRLPNIDAVDRALNVTFGLNKDIWEQ